MKHSTCPGCFSWNSTEIKASDLEQNDVNNYHFGRAFWHLESLQETIKLSVPNESKIERHWQSKLANSKEKLRR